MSLELSEKPLSCYVLFHSSCSKRLYLGLTGSSAPARLHLDLVLKEAVSATQGNHSGLAQVILVQLVQDGRRHDVAEQAQHAHQEHDQAQRTRALLRREEEAQVRVCFCGRAALTKSSTDRHFEADGVGRDEQARSEGREVVGAAHGPAGVGLGQGDHPVGPPLLLALAEVLTQGGKHADLQTSGRRVRAGPAGRAHVDEVVQGGVVRPTTTNLESG